MRTTSSLALGLLITTIAAVSATAQTAGDQTASSPIVCGTTAMERIDHAEAIRNTARNNPELHRRMLARQNSPSLLSVQDETLLYAFYVFDNVKKEYEEKMAALFYDGRFARVWVDVRDTLAMKSGSRRTKLLALYKGLDSNISVATNVPPRDASKSILQNDLEVFGPVPPDPQWEDKTNFLLFDIIDNLGGNGYVVGYFTQHDRTTEQYSNRMNLLYIDNNPTQGFASIPSLLNTIAHEFQHLIHHGRHPTTAGSAKDRDIIFNEGLSEVASMINGFWERYNHGYLANTNVDFFDWSYGDGTKLLADYERAMTFVHFLREKFGERILWELPGAPGKNMPRLDEALRRTGSSMNYIDVLKAFAVANVVRSSSPLGYSLLLNKSNAGPRPHVSFTGAPNGNSNTAVLQPYGIYNVAYGSPGPMRVRFSGSADARVVMMGLRNGTYDVIDIPMNVDHQLPPWEGGAYETVTFSIINTAETVREAQWAATALTLGVEDDAVAAGRLQITGFSSGTGAASIRFVLPSALPARVELFNLRGERVALVTEVAGTGLHTASFPTTGLSSGGYILRISQGGRAVSRLINLTF